MPCGDLKLHLETIRKMLPHFHASAHLTYAKCAHLYLQQMSTLEEKMSSEEFEAFTPGVTSRSGEQIRCGQEYGQI